MRRTVYDWKNEFMDLRRRPIFHYLLFGNSQNADGSSGSSGLAELPGNDFIVTMGNWGLPTLNLLINLQASTVMHELGHNLGLRHGGFEDTNYKPNYWSVMNYLYQLEGMDGNPSGRTAYQRWLYYTTAGPTQTPLLCAMANSPCGLPAQFIMDYSDGTSSSLNETALYEANNIGRGSTTGAYADWYMNGSLTTTPLSIIFTVPAQTILSDYNDWGNLSLPFDRSANVNSGISLTSSPKAAVVSNPITDDRQPAAEEVVPSAFFMDQLRRAH